MKADYTNLFIMRDPFATRPMQLTTEGEPRLKRDDFSKFLRCLERGECEADPPLQLRQYAGGKPTDIMWRPLVISTRVVDLLTKHNITGWKTYAVEIFDKKGQRVPGYYGLGITGRAGKRDLTRGLVLDKLPIVPGGIPFKVLKGFYFKDDFWDGSDFCLCVWEIVTRKVVALFKKAGIRNVEFTPLLEYEEDVSNFQLRKEWPEEGLGDQRLKLEEYKRWEAKIEEEYEKRKQKTIP